jgi:hypothetical protein
LNGKTLAKKRQRYILTLAYDPADTGEAKKEPPAQLDQ